MWVYVIGFLLFAGLAVVYARLAKRKGSKFYRVLSVLSALVSVGFLVLIVMVFALVAGVS